LRRRLSKTSKRRPQLRLLGEKTWLAALSLVRSIPTFLTASTPAHRLGRDGSPELVDLQERPVRRLNVDAVTKDDHMKVDEDLRCLLVRRHLADIRVAGATLRL
jgi:hypothetical protein